MATVGGNLLQRTRCYYFYDTAFAACNKRVPGSGCAALEGYNRIHAILGASDACVATQPFRHERRARRAARRGRACKAARGERRLPIGEFHRLPGDTPSATSNLEPGELIVAVDLPAVAVRRALALPEGARPGQLRVRAGLGGRRRSTCTTASCATPRSRSAASRTSRGASPRPKQALIGRPLDDASIAAASDAPARRRAAAPAQRLQGRAGAPLDRAGTEDRRRHRVITGQGIDRVDGKLKVMRPRTVRGRVPGARRRACRAWSRAPCRAAGSCAWTCRGAGRCPA